MAISVALLIWAMHTLWLTFIPLGSIPPLSPELIKHCHDLLQPPPSTHPSRLSNLVTALVNVPVDTPSAVWIAEPGTSAAYFLDGFSSQDWWLSERPLLIAITPPTLHEPREIGANITILTAKFEYDRARLIKLPEGIRGWVTYLPWLENESAYEILAGHLGRERPIILDGQVRSFIAEGLDEAFEAPADEKDRTILKKIRQEVQLIRERKDEREVGLLRCANQFTLHAIRKTRSKLRFGMHESQVRQILSRELVHLGMDGEEGLVLFGENAALPHGEGTDRKLGKEDMVLIDVGGTWGGYVADITRTFSIGGSRIPRDRIESWETVRRAQSAVVELIKSNHSKPLTFADLDAAARQVISTWTSRTFPDWRVTPGVDYRALTHRTGHGIGLDGHESPYLVQGPLGMREVQPGHVFSIEPGIYLNPESGGYGIRLEDCFVVQEKDGKLSGEWLSGPVKTWGDV